METREQDTHQNILSAGKAEFLEKGFRDASLRNIVQKAGVTTGAFYGYYKSKEELFDQLVGEVAQASQNKFVETQNTFASLPPAEQPKCMNEITGKCITWMVDYIYQHFEAFKLLVCRAEGTKYEQFIHTLVEVETEATHQFVKVLNSLGHEVPHIDDQLEHLLVSGFFSSFFEIVRHEMPKEKAVKYISELRAFYSAGWARILGLPIR